METPFFQFFLGGMRIGPLSLMCGGGGTAAMSTNQASASWLTKYTDDFARRVEEVLGDDFRILLERAEPFELFNVQFMQLHFHFCAQVPDYSPSYDVE